MSPPNSPCLASPIMVTPREAAAALACASFSSAFPLSAKWNSTAATPWRGKTSRIHIRCAGAGVPSRPDVVGEGHEGSLVERLKAPGRLEVEPVLDEGPEGAQEGLDVLVGLGELAERDGLLPLGKLENAHHAAAFEEEGVALGAHCPRDFAPALGVVEEAFELGFLPGLRFESKTHEHAATMGGLLF